MSKVAGPLEAAAGMDPGPDARVTCIPRKKAVVGMLLPLACEGLGVCTAVASVISVVLLGDKSENGNGKPGQGLGNVRTEAALATAGIRAVAHELSEGRHGDPFTFECSTPGITPHTQ